MQNLFGSFWKYGKWPIGVIVLALVALVVYRIPFVLEEDRAAEAVKRIEGKRLTLADVMGENLPPKPDPALVDATVAGVDANGNGIRDDVELSIFEKYPNSPRTRAPLLQYAMALQTRILEVYNKETFVAASQSLGRASSCLSDSVSREDLGVFFETMKKLESSIDTMQLNTPARESASKEVVKFTTSFGPSDTSDYCDVAL